MLWSLIKILLFVAVVAAITYGAGMLMDMQEGVRVIALGQEFTLGPIHVLIGALVLLLAVWLILKLTGLLVAVLRFLNGDETALSRYFDRNREKKGYQALADGMMALASGEGRLALTKAARAERYLRKPELTNLLSAQAAEASGDKHKAAEVYKRLLEDDKTRFVGVHGLMKQKLAAGDTETALKLAEKAFALKPRHVDTQDALLQLQADNEDWAGARKTLNAKLKHGAMPRDVHKRRDAVLALSEARDVLADGKTVEAREAAIEANRLSPDLVPAAVMAARTYLADGKKRYAVRVIKKAWAVNPHPDLAAVFADVEPDETPTQRRYRFKALSKLAPENPETKMLMAEINIACEDWAGARKALGSLVDDAPTTRSIALLAAIERGEGSEDAVVRGLLTKALTVSRGPQWVCDKCQTVHTHWGPVCENCSSFDALSWRVPPSGDAVLPGATEMLPLIVGAIEDQPTEEAELVEEAVEDDADTNVEPEVVAEGEVIVVGTEEKAQN